MAVANILNMKLCASIKNGLVGYMKSAEKNNSLVYINTCLVV